MCSRKYRLGSFEEGDKSALYYRCNRITARRKVRERVASSIHDSAFVECKFHHVPDPEDTPEVEKDRNIAQRKLGFGRGDLDILPIPAR
jgi:hypothetical protein